MSRAAVTVLDGAMGTLLESRGVETPPPLWSAAALSGSPALVRDIHHEYRLAGAQVHTTCTFRTHARNAGEQWATLTRAAVALAREAAGTDGRVAGSIAPLEDCFRPDLSPDNPGPEHARLARALCEAGVDLLLCETFPHLDEAVACVSAAHDTGTQVWASLTAGPEENLLTVGEIHSGAARLIEAGASAVLVNCVPVQHTTRYVEALADLGVPFGAYANAGPPGKIVPPQRYAAFAQEWVERGATLVGGCCGTNPAHIRALSERLRPGEHQR